MLHAFRRDPTLLAASAIKWMMLGLVFFGLLGQLREYQSPISLPVLRPVVHDTRWSEPPAGSDIYLPATPSHENGLLIVTFGATAAVGVLAVASPLCWRRVHHLSTVVFLGGVALLMVENFVSDLWFCGPQSHMLLGYALEVLTLIACVAGLSLELRRYDREPGRDA